jgi:hypothetical protein
MPLLSLDRPATQQTNHVAPVHEPKLLVQSDGRLSYRDSAGRWTRYATEIPVEVFYKTPEFQRRRLLLDGFSESRRNGAQVVIVRVIRRTS